MMFRGCRVLCVLDTMWGNDGRAPRWFTINPENASGKRLYKITGTEPPAVWVTNCCPEQVSSASMLGTPSAEWLRKSLEWIPEGLRTAPLLVCGRRANATYDATGYVHPGSVYRMKHPAARDWTKAEIEETRLRITEALQCKL